MSGEAKSKPSLLELLEQDKIWINRAGQRVKISRMEFQYAGNIVRWLQARADHLKFAAELRWLGFIEMLNGEMARDVADHEFALFMGLRAEKWLRRRPLMHALQKRLDEEPDA
jgi:hypothetical protein